MVLLSIAFNYLPWSQVIHHVLFLFQEKSSVVKFRYSKRPQNLKNVPPCFDTTKEHFLNFTLQFPIIFIESKCIKVRITHFNLFQPIVEAATGASAIHRHTLRGLYPRTYLTLK